MNQEIIEFWQRNKTPIGLMVQNARLHGVTPQQVERAAQIVYEEAQEIIFNGPESYIHTNGNDVARIVLFRNMLKPNRLGWRVFIVAKSLRAAEYDTELAQSKRKVKELETKIEKKKLSYRFKQWFKTIKWELDEWQ